MSDDLQALTLEQQIGQTFAVGFPGTTPTPAVFDLIRRRHVGSVILFSRNIRSAAQALDLTASLQEAARAGGHPAPLLIMVDQENGLVRRLGADATIFPGNMALGATGSEALTRDVTTASGRELAALGINMNLAPVVDVNNNHANPVIGVRSFGEDPELVARLGLAAVRGYHSAGVVGMLKHFPGHGDTATDSHLALPVIPATRDRLDRVELVPFARGIAAGAECVMIAHVALPVLLAPGDILPASISPPVVRDLLREQLGFDGVAITDCLEMDAIAEGVGVARGAVMALLASNDLVLVSHRIDRQEAAIDAALAAVRSGEVPPARVAEAAGRVLRLKQRHLAWDRLPDARGLDVVGSAAHRQLAAAAYAASTTIVRDREARLPLRLDPSGRVLVVVVAPRDITRAADVTLDDDTLLASVRRYHERSSCSVLRSHDAPGAVDATVRAAREADQVLLVTVNAHLSGERTDVANQIAVASRGVVGIAACNPYDASALPHVDAYLATYEYSPAALDAAVDVIFGRASAQGRLPVTLPGVHGA